MQKYVELLEAVGVALELESEEDIADPCAAHYDIFGTKFYTTAQIDSYGPQSGLYYVIEGNDTAWPIGLSYHDELSLPKRRKTHFYNPVVRFRHALTQLAGQSGEVPPRILQMVAKKLELKHKLETVWRRKAKVPYKSEEFRVLEKFEFDPETIWTIVRKFLRDEKLGLYYNRIPYILNRFGARHAKMSGKQYQNIMSEFEDLVDVFKEIKESLNRKYFPDMRYVALRLMAKNEVKLPYSIPWANTKRKLKTLDDSLSIMEDCV